MTGSMLPMMEISHAGLNWTRIRVSGIRRTTYEEFMEEQTVKKRNDSRISRRSTLSRQGGSSRYGETGAEDVGLEDAVKRLIGRGELPWRLRTNNSTTSRRCRLCMLRTDQAW